MIEKSSGYLGYAAWAITGIVGMVIFIYLAFVQNWGGWALIPAGVITWFLLAVLENIIAVFYMFLAKTAQDLGHTKTMSKFWFSAAEHSADISGQNFETHIKRK